MIEIFRMKVQFYASPKIDMLLPICQQCLTVKWTYPFGTDKLDCILINDTRALSERSTQRLKHIFHIVASKLQFLFSESIMIDFSFHLIVRIWLSSAIFQIAPIIITKFYILQGCFSTKNAVPIHQFSATKMCQIPISFSVINNTGVSGFLQRVICLVRSDNMFIRMHFIRAENITAASYSLCMLYIGTALCGKQIIPTIPFINVRSFYRPTVGSAEYFFRLSF